MISNAAATVTGAVSGAVSSAGQVIGKAAEDARQVAVAGVEVVKELATGKPAVPEDKLAERCEWNV